MATARRARYWWWRYGELVHFKTSDDWTTQHLCAKPICAQLGARPSLDVQREYLVYCLIQLLFVSVGAGAVMLPPSAQSARICFEPFIKFYNS